MAKYAGVWGIDLGQAAFKALRCKLDNGQVVADAFDYIEYPKILSQPEAEPEKMIRDAMRQFLSRNDIKGHRIALAVPGQSGLAKFFKPPPVDAKKIPEIVKYEARQQIPFALDDVIWDFQQMGGGAEVDGFSLETEVGLFAMKREQVFRAMRPFQEAGVELDIIQLAPLSIYNFVSYDILRDGPAAEDYDPDNPPPSLVVLSMGTDTTDLVITNGFRVWQRSVPLGGNHFTKQLTKELKLTFAKAEHLKRNARQAEDPKLIYMAMRSVFNDLVTEVQRSVGYFQGIDRKAKIDGVVVLGNAFKLPGLQQYLGKNLGYEVKSVEAFSRLQGPAVLSAPAFRDNQLSFGVCYGLCLQGVGEATLKTNLVPREIVTDRLVRSKKPWAVASVGALLLACTFNVFFYFGRLHQVAEDRAVAGVTWKQATSQIESANTLSSNYEREDEQLVAQLGRITAIGEELVGNADRRLLWLELLKTVNTALPTTAGITPGEIPDVDKVPFHQREEIHVEKFEVQYFEDLQEWFTEAVKTKYVDQQRSLGSDVTDEDAAGADGTVGTAGGVATGPTGEGWVIELKCHHFFNQDMQRQGIAHALSTLINNLQNGTVMFPVMINKIVPGVVVRYRVTPDRFVDLHVTSVTPVLQPDVNTGADRLAGYQLTLEGMEETPIVIPPDERVDVVFAMKEMGIAYPLVLEDSKIDPNYQVPNPNYEPPETGFPGGGGGTEGGLLGGMTGPGMGPMGTLAGGAAGTQRPRGGRGNVAGTGTERDEDASGEPPTLVVPRYDFIVQFTWTEKLLTDRLKQQAEEWQQQRSSAPRGDDADLAANFRGGA
jgi:type IV pilus assembly protein PilM